MIRQTRTHRRQGRRWVRIRLVIAPVHVAAFIIVPPASATMVVTIVAPVFPTVVATVAVVIRAPMAVALPVLRRVFVAIPVVLHEIDAFAASTVAMAMATPVAGMAGRDTQVQRGAADRPSVDHQRLREKQRRRWETADVDAAIESGLANIDRNLGGRWGAEGSDGDGCGEE